MAYIIFEAKGYPQNFKFLAKLCRFGNKNHIFLQNLKYRMIVLIYERGCQMSIKNDLSQIYNFRCKIA